MNGKAWLVALVVMGTIVMSSVFFALGAIVGSLNAGGSRMSIEKKTVFAVACDGCGEDFTSMDYGAEHFDDEGAAVDALTDHDWQVVGSGRELLVFCPKCSVPTGSGPYAPLAPWEPCE